MFASSPPGRSFVVSVLLAFGLLLGGCAKTSSPALNAVAQTEQSVVYGTDDRQDYYASSNQTLRKLTAESIVALLNPWAIDASDPNNIQFPSTTLGEAHGLCSSERFLNQPTASFCSGTLIDDDLVLTAGHCVNPADTDCPAEVRFVFNYYLDAADTLATVTAADVYSCQEVVAYAQGTSNGLELDFAVVKLDRPVTSPHAPASVNTNNDLIDNNTEVNIIGMGSGIPAKLDDGGRVIDPRTSLRDYFLATTDSFGGNSGSGVFNNDGEVIGILVRGARDYTSVGNCNVVNVVPDVGAGAGESVTYIQRAMSQLCTSGWPSQRLCNATARCGDGQCTGSEDIANCPDDCTATCGNSHCESGEAESCPEDCGNGMSVNWTCDGSYFGAGDGCDCNCGALDPDCNVPTQRLYNCEDGEICNADGACVAGNAPAEWTCDAAYFAAGDGCDCSCGALDPDCADSTQSLYGCESGEVCGQDGSCETSTGWICKPDFFDSNDGCDCNCGTRDPDCDKAGQQLFGCQIGESCNAEGACSAGGGADALGPDAAVPTSWTCAPSSYNAQDDCDCNCGAYDPDCDDDSRTVIGCLGDCLADGTCDGLGCSHLDVDVGNNGSTKRSPFWLALFLAPLLVWRHRRRGVPMLLALVCVSVQAACVTDQDQTPPLPSANAANAARAAGQNPSKSNGEAVEVHAGGDEASPGITAPLLTASPQKMTTLSPVNGTEKRADGESCDAAEQCAGGVCEGKGCDKSQGVCASHDRNCTKDHRAYCGCDGKTFYGSGSCPGARYLARRRCETM